MGFSGRGTALGSRKRDRGGAGSTAALRGFEDEDEEDEEDVFVGWSPVDSDPDVQLEYDDICDLYWRAGCSRSRSDRSWIGARGRPGIAWGNYMFEIKVLGSDDLVKVGWTPADSSRAVGSEFFSFGYGGTGKKSTGSRFAEYGPPFGRGDIIGCLLNREKRFIAFTLNGEFLGKAFPIPASYDGVPLFPTVCARQAFLVAGYFGTTDGRGLPFGYRGYWPIAGAADEDVGEVDEPEPPSKRAAAGGVKVDQQMLDSNEAAARIRRENRFETPSPAPVPSRTPAEKAPSRTPASTRTAGTSSVEVIRKVGSIDLSSVTQVSTSSAVAKSTTIQLSGGSSGSRSSAPSQAKVTKSTICHIPVDRSRSPLNARRKGTTGARALVGLSEDLERPYVRFTNLPRPIDVRPVRVLHRSFDLVKERWARERDWVWAGEMLRSIRQDLTVQLVRSRFAVEVYEFCARIALEVGDFKQFDQCSTQLEELHDDTEIGATEHENEFLAYRLLYLLLNGDCSGLALASFLQRRGKKIRAQAKAGDLYLSLAWKLRTAIAAGRLPDDLHEVIAKESQSDSKTRNGVAVESPGAAFERLYLLLLENARLRHLTAVCRSCKPGVTRSLLVRFGLDSRPKQSSPDAGTCEDEVWPVVLCRKNAEAVDVTTTIAEAEKSLASKSARGGGQKLRLGHQSMDHASLFVRTAAIRPTPTPR
eukprot:TRINITY_DN747_c4_g1_i2.p1 TRINITY_DN747_c4_g1~~TRINITY_DN747_c4_g1_i2.p1  ORF type:complete len:702 (-),score=95.53 TRINITY_DN747_c4_g1_i2:119-2224(-)